MVLDVIRDAAVAPLEDGEEFGRRFTHATPDGAFLHRGLDVPPQVLDIVGGVLARELRPLVGRDPIPHA